MSFEVLDRDLMGRIGRLKTKRGSVETPLLLPVINPLVQPISPEEMKRAFGCEALITNAYLLKKNFGEEVKAEGIHDFLNFEKVVFTDSGAYQILRYGRVETNAEEIARFEEEIDTDVAVILDIPTGWNAKRETAEYTVAETLRRARLTLNSLTRRDILWVGPVQGGNHLDLVAHSASEIGKMPFQIHALGSPTQIMERYLFSLLMNMILTAKKSLPIDRPLHLFGAGHPFLFSFAVAAGCDIFDSAAYALYARQNRYMTDYGTIRLNDLMYFPCSCGVCSKYTPKEVKELATQERRKLLAWHNLETCLTEIKRIKQSIKMGRLWELLEIRSRSHPSLLQAFNSLSRYQECFEEYAPTSKEKAVFYFDSAGLARPEIVRYRLRLGAWTPSEEYSLLLLLPQPSSKPFNRSREYRRLRRLLNRDLGEAFRSVHICTYVSPFGIVPYELEEVYPLSQNEAVQPPDWKTILYVAKQVEEYVADRAQTYKTVVLYSDSVALGLRVRSACRRICSKRGINLVLLKPEGELWSKGSLDSIVDAVLKTLRMA